MFHAILMRFNQIQRLHITEQDIADVYEVSWYPAIHFLGIRSLRVAVA